MTRRGVLLAIAAASARAALVVDVQVPPKNLERTTMGVAADSFQFSPRPKTAYEFLEYCYSLGAGGVQARFPASFDGEYVSRLRRRAEDCGMYLEISVSLPGEDTRDFERTVEAAKGAGAVALRAACLGGRRYETFSTLEDWKRFVADSKAKIARAVPILEKHRMPLGIENHKDWTTDELVALMKQLSSEYLGVCIDTGNNVALLDGPMEVVESLAPYAMNTHLKDMAVEEYSEGFLLLEVPFGEGMLDMGRIVQTVLKARPQTRLTLEMITRNPLKVPCLAEKYWVTFSERGGLNLARTLAMVRSHKPRHPLPQLDGLSSASRVRLEEDNVRQCFAFARDNLGLRAAKKE